jgi:hypothetical protein
MIDILAMSLAVILPAVVMFCRLKREPVWVSVVRCLGAIAVFWCCLALAQYYDSAARVRDGRAHDMAEAEVMAGYLWGPSFWFIPGTLYAGFLLFFRVLLRRDARRIEHAQP